MGPLIRKTDDETTDGSLDNMNLEKRRARWTDDILTFGRDELLTLLKHLSSSPVFSGVRVTQSLVLYVCFADRCLFFCTFFFWPLCCLFFYHIAILITHLVSSNYSKHIIYFPPVFCFVSRSCLYGTSCLAKVL